MIAMVLALLAQTPETVSLAQARAGDAEALAPVLLSAEVAARVEGGLVRRQWSPGQVYFAQFWEPPVVESQGLCRRAVHWRRMSDERLPGDDSAPDDAPLTIGEASGGTQYAVSYPQAATEEICGQVAGWFSVREQTRAAELKSIGRLTEAMRQAAGREALPFDLSCDGEEPETCRDARKALADLPLDRVLGVRMRNTEYRSEPVRNGVRMRYMQPVENDRWPQAEVAFDMSGEGARSWTVVLKGIDRLEAVEMRRSTIIRH